MRVFQQKKSKIELSIIECTRIKSNYKLGIYINIFISVPVAPTSKKYSRDEKYI